MDVEGDSEAIWEIAKSLSEKAIAGLVSARLLVSLATRAERTIHRAAFAYVLGRVADEIATDCLVRFLSSTAEDESVRTHAAESLGLLRDRRATDALLATLNDSSAGVRFWSAYALGEIGDRRAVPALRRLADSDDSEIEGWGSLRDEAIEAVRRIEGKAELL
jgi:HEAT repeat protein